MGAAAGLLQVLDTCCQGLDAAHPNAQVAQAFLELSSAFRTAFKLFNGPRGG